MTIATMRIARRLALLVGAFAAFWLISLLSHSAIAHASGLSDHPRSGSGHVGSLVAKAARSNGPVKPAALGQRHGRQIAQPHATTRQAVQHQSSKHQAVQPKAPVSVAKIAMPATRLVRAAVSTSPVPVAGELVNPVLNAVEATASATDTLLGQTVGAIVPVLPPVVTANPTLPSDPSVVVSDHRVPSTALATVAGQAGAGSAMTAVTTWTDLAIGLVAQRAADRPLGSQAELTSTPSPVSSPVPSAPSAPTEPDHNGIATSSAAGASAGDIVAAFVSSPPHLCGLTVHQTDDFTGGGALDDPTFSPD
ncbi:hypothetical protein ACSMXN_24155 [Jatrophihabitans sp. DSM 45814]